MIDVDIPFGALLDGTRRESRLVSERLICEGDKEDM
jgi:hypothetical protein